MAKRRKNHEGYIRYRDSRKHYEGRITVDGKPIIVYPAAVGAAGLDAYLRGEALKSPLTDLSYEDAKMNRDSAEFAKW